MHFAFIGGTRFIGHTAAAAALARDHRVTVLHRGNHPSEVTGAAEIIVDRNDPSALCRELKRLAPDVVIDTRAMTKADAEVSALALKLLGVPGVVLSSHDVYAQFGRLNGLPAPDPVARIDEDAALTVPFPFRGLAEHEGGPDYDKKIVEAVFREAVGDGAPGVTVLRLPAIFGARDNKRRFGALVDRFDAGNLEVPSRGGAKFRWTHSHVRDVAHAIVLACEKPAAGFRVYNVGEAETPTMGERAEAIAANVGVEMRWIEAEGELPPPFAMFGEFANDFVADSTRLRKELGWSELTTERERVADVVSWARLSRASVH